MHVRRVLVAVSTALFLTGGAVALPATAGIAIPRDMIVTPNTGPVGTQVTISNAENSPCGGQKGDGPAAVDVLVTPPDGNDSLGHANLDEAGNWSLVFIDTTQVGVYLVDAECFDTPAPTDASTRATDFDYTEATFVITAAEPTTTAAPTTTSTAAPAAAVDATAAFTG